MRLKIFFLNFAALFLLSIFGSLCLFADTDLSAKGEVPNFHFTDQNEKEVKLADLKGHIWIADFIFTRCQSSCPMLSGRMRGLAEGFDDPVVKLVSFTVDPEHDTPQVLSKYAKKYEAQSGKWYFLTGDKQILRKFITDGFSLGVEDATQEDLKAGAEPVMHSNRFVLVDPDGKIRGYYDSSDKGELDRLVRDTFSLIKKEKN